MSGEEFGPYRLLERLGAGGMGEVWRARDTRTDREVAIKRLRPAFAGDPSYVAGFRREAALAAKLNHPAIVPIHSYGEIDEQLYIEMPLLAGADLTTLIARDGPLDPARAVEVIAQVAEALDTAHAAGLVHRDVKPSNVMVQARRRGDFVHLIDFGIARSADTTATHTGPGLVGTLTYMAPERFEGGAGDIRSDVYALAGVLFYALTGQKPFVAPPNTEPDLLYYLNSHLHRPPPRPSDYAPAAVRADLVRLDPVVARGMAKRPADRYPSAGELAAAAHAALETSAGRDSSAPVRAPHVPAPSAPLARTPPPAPRVVSTVAGRAGAPPAASRAGHGTRPPAPLPPEQRPRQAVGSRPTRPAPPPTPPPAAPTAAPAAEPPRPSAARRRTLRDVGAAILVLGVIGAALAWAILPTTATPPPTVEHTLTGHTNWVFGVTTAQLDGRTVVVSGSADNTMRVWDLAGGTPVGSPLTGHTGPVSSVATAQLDGRTVLVSGSWDTTVRVWDLATGKAIGAPFTGHTGPVFAVATAQLDGRTAVVSGSADDTVRVWDLATGRPIGAPFTGHTAAVAAVTTAQLDGRPVAISGSNDNTVRVWDLATGNPIGAPFTGHTGYVQAVTTAQLDGRTVVLSGGDDNAVRVWDLATRAPVGAPFTGHTKRVVAVTTAQLRGRTVALSGGWDNTVQVWDLATRAPAGSPFTDHTDFVCAVTTAPSGERTTVVSGGRDDKVRVWDLEARTRQ